MATQEWNEEDAASDARVEPRTAESALEAELQELRRRNEDLQATCLRAQADYQNLRRRQLADIEAAVRRSQAPQLENLLLVLDHLEMALATEWETAEAKTLAAGVQMTRDQLLQALEREEVRPISTQGDFDPSLHEAVGTVETDEQPPGTILGVVRSGWTYRGAVLRPAHVKVATLPDRKKSADPAR